MEFRPCIDIHNGKVKQIVGSSLCDEGNEARENFVAEKEADYYARLYAKEGLRGGHVILLNGVDSVFYEATRRQAFKALEAYPGGLQAGGGITAENAREYLRRGASHVIVTSYVFRDGRILYENLRRLRETVGREHIVLDLSCKKTPEGYRIMTDRWQKTARELLNEELLEELSDSCDEFLIHAVDVEGKGEGIERELVTRLGSWEGIPVTYAGGVHSQEDIELIKILGKGRVHVTVGSALDLFGGSLSMAEIIRCVSRAE